MPTELSWYCRLVWMIALLMVLIADSETKTPYRWWCRYTFATLLFAPLFWPELSWWTDDFPAKQSGWTDAFWPVLVILTHMRVIAVLEAFHFHTRKFIWWSSLSASVFTMAFAFSGLVKIARAAPTYEHARDAFMELCAYGNIWCAAAMLTSGGLFLCFGGWRKRQDDFHALIVTLLCLGHGITSLIHVAGPPSMARWQFWNVAVTISDGLLYLTWAVGITLFPPKHAAVPRKMTSVLKSRSACSPH